MPLETPAITRVEVPGFEGLEIMDCDVHNGSGPKLVPYLPARWRDYLAMVGRRNVFPFGATSAQRPGACRLDTFPPGRGEGGPEVTAVYAPGTAAQGLGSGGPGSDPDFAREQLLDEYGISAAVLSTLDWQGGGNAPVELEIEIARATNDFNVEEWLSADPRWYASIIVEPEHPEAAAAEIARCRELDDRFVQVLIGSRTERPAGNPKYWPIYEAAAHYGLPVAFHVGTTKYHSWTGIGTGAVDYYYEVHVGFPIAAQTIAASMVFEGVFERFPTLKVFAAELGWEWAVPYGWRMDATWRVHRAEVAHLQRRPSEYLGEHFWFSTQPCVEPEDPSQFDAVYEQFVEMFGNHLMFATDYPHWDMDSPFDALPPWMPRETKQRILATNASELYGIPLTRERGSES